MNSKSPVGGEKKGELTLSSQIPKPRAASLISPRKYSPSLGDSTSEQDSASKTTPTTTPIKSVTTPVKSPITKTTAPSPTRLTPKDDNAIKKKPRTTSALGKTTQAKIQLARPASSMDHVRHVNPPSMNSVRATSSNSNVSKKVTPSPKKSDTLKVKLTTSAKPIKIEESQLFKEFTSIQNTLQTRSQEDWSERHKALLKLEAILLGGATEFPSFYKEFELIKRPLLLMVSDLRSVIVKETCVILCLLSKRLQSAFARFVPLYIHDLMKQSVVSIRVIADAADICIRTMLKYTFTTQIKDITDGCKDLPSVLTRQRCVGYLIVMLTDYPMQTLEKIKNSIYEVIPLLLSDASNEVRSEARNCFHLFSHCFPDDGQKILDGLDLVVQKYLQKEVPKIQRSEDQNGKKTIEDDGQDETGSNTASADGNAIAEWENQKLDDFNDESQDLLEQLNEKSSSLPSLDEEQLVPSEQQTEEDEMY